MGCQDLLGQTQPFFPKVWNADRRIQGQHLAASLRGGVPEVSGSYGFTWLRYLPYLPYIRPMLRALRKFLGFWKQIESKVFKSGWEMLKEPPFFRGSWSLEGFTCEVVGQIMAPFGIVGGLSRCPTVWEFNITFVLLWIVLNSRAMPKMSKKFSSSPWIAFGQVPPEIRLNGVSQAGYWYQRHRHEASPGDVPSSDHTERKKIWWVHPWWRSPKVRNRYYAIFEALVT